MKILFFLFLYSVRAHSLDDVDLIPRGVNSSAMRFGEISGLDTRFTSNGNLMSIQDIQSIEFNVKTLSSLQPQIKDLVIVLNSFGIGNYGDKLSLGTLHFDVQPSLSYSSLIHAWGASDKLTIGVGIPVIHYTNNIHVIHSGSNIEEYKKQFGGVSSEMDRAFDRLSINLPQAVNEELQKRGYKPLVHREESFIGDIQVVGMYELLRDEQIKIVYKGVIGLPTGPKPDPSDLLSLNSFGQTSLENNLMSSFMLDDDLFVNQRLGYRYILPDHEEVFVPEHETTTLSRFSNKENLQRSIGGSVLFGTSINYHWNSYLSLAAGYEFQKKSSDKYEGDSASSFSTKKNYQLLSSNTELALHKTRIEITYSTVKSYLARMSFLPMLVNFEISDTTSAINSPRQVLSELTLMLFY